MMSPVRESLIIISQSTIGAHTCMQRVPTVAQFDTCMSGHCIYCTFKPKMKQILGNTSIGWSRRVTTPKGWTKHPPGVMHMV